MARLTAAEKQKRYRERLKQNPEKYEESKRKHREHYHKIKRLAKDLLPKERKQANLIWKLRQREYRKRRKNLQSIIDVTPPSSPLPRVQDIQEVHQTPPASPVSNASRERGRKIVKKYKSKVYRTNKKLEEENKKLKRLCEKYKKKLMRSNKQKELNTNEKPGDNQSYNLLTKSIKDRYKTIRSLSEKRLLKSIFKTGIIETSKKKAELLKETLGIHREYHKKAKTNRSILLLRKKIRQFFVRDDVSRATAGKKETVTRNGNKMQRRYLLDTMKKLHIEFQKENPNTPCSYYYFTKHRPFYVIAPSIDARETCMCKTHANMSYIAQALTKQGLLKTGDLNVIIRKTVCSDRLKDCMYNKCETCKNQKIDYDQNKINGTVKYSEWVRKEVKFEKNEKIIKAIKNVKEEKIEEVAHLRQKFEKDIISFKKHIYNIKIQFHNFRECLGNLQPNECAMVVDFSENYNCKYHEEVQSHHFGGSRNQITLHTVMVYTHNHETQHAANSFGSVSASNCHQPAAIWSHLQPILEWIRNSHESVDTIHFFSDGPSTQYRQKQNFYLLCTKYFDYGFTAATWSFYEAGHGKGPADGIGGFLKRKADKLVATDADIPNAYAFFKQLENTSKIKMFLIKEEAIKKLQDDLPKKIPRLIGTLQVHQVFTDKRNTLKYRELSCFCKFIKRGFCNCLNPKTYQVNYNTANVNSAKQILEPERHDLQDPPDEDVPLAVLKQIQNIPSQRSIYRAVYGSSSDSDEDESQIDKENRKSLAIDDKFRFQRDQVASTSYDKIPRQVSTGDFLHVYVYGSNKKKNIYSYACKALSSIEEDGEIKVMFLRVVGNDAKKFRQDKWDISYVNYEDVISILPVPSLLDEDMYQFPVSIDIFEK